MNVRGAGMQDDVVDRLAGSRTIEITTVGHRQRAGDADRDLVVPGRAAVHHHLIEVCLGL
jgi:hypothetical protein